MLLNDAENNAIDDIVNVAKKREQKEETPSQRLANRDKRKLDAYRESVKIFGKEISTRKIQNLYKETSELLGVNIKKPVPVIFLCIN